MNYEEPIHRIIGGIVHSPAFADKLPQQREFYNLTPPEYWELLHAHASAFRMWKVTYMHTLPSHEAVMDWYRGTGMRPYLQALDDAGRKKFEAEMFAQVREEYPTQSDGSIIFPFPTFLLPRDSVEARRIRVLGGATCFPRRQLWVDLATGLAVMPLAAALFPIAMAFAYAARCGGAVLRRQSARSRWGWS